MIHFIRSAPLPGHSLEHPEGICQEQSARKNEEEVKRRLQQLYLPNRAFLKVFRNLLFVVEQTAFTRRLASAEEKPVERRLLHCDDHTSTCKPIRVGIAPNQD
jgi:hypothetical protein